MTRLNFYSSVLLRRSLALLLISIIVSSCEKWTPQADGYFTIDGKRYNVYIMVIYKETFGSPPYYNTEVTLQGAPYVNASLFVSTPSPTLTQGDYHVSYSYEPMGINSLSIFHGSSSSQITTDQNSSGTMTVRVSGRNYLVDFDGHLQGHAVKIHYSGLVSQQ